MIHRRDLAPGPQNGSRTLRRHPSGNGRFHHGDQSFAKRRRYFGCRLGQSEKLWGLSWCQQTQPSQSNISMPRAVVPVPATARLARGGSELEGILVLLALLGAAYAAGYFTRDYI